MKSYESAYTQNRRQGRARVRTIADLPPELVQALDKWGGGAGMKSRRETIEALLKKGLEVAAGGEFGDQAPAARIEAAAR